MKVASRPRPAGEAARAVWTLYDVQLNPDTGIGTKYNPNDGTDWAMGTTSKLGQLPHDGALGLDGTIYFTSNNPNRGVTIGKVESRDRRGEVPQGRGGNGLAATAHGLARDRAGNLWFDINPGRRALGKLDTATEKITIYQTPADMAPVGGAVTIDVDGKGMVWASTPRGAVRFDPSSEKFTEFKSVIPRRTLAARERPTARPATATATAGGRRWRWTRSTRATSRAARPIEIKLPDVKASTACLARTAPSTRP
jgi:streptogramin lyase